MATDATETAKQENGSKVFFKEYIEKNERDMKKLTKIVKEYYPEVTDVWMKTYEKQAAALKKYLGEEKGYKYSRNEGFMEFIETVAKQSCGVSVKDRWNPADIYMIKTSKEPVIKQEIKKKTSSSEKSANLLQLNAYMRKLVNSKDLLPISLKAIALKTPYAKLELANMGSSHSIDFVFQGSLKCQLSIGNKTPYEFDTGELSFDFSVNGDMVHGQSRNFQYSQARNVVQTDLTPKGRSAGAKLGKVSSTALDKFLTSNGLARPQSASSNPNIPPVGKWNETHKKYWIKLFKELKTKKVGGSQIDFGNLTVFDPEKKQTLSGFENVLNYAIKYESKTRSAAGRFSSKLIAMEWARIWAKIDEKKLLKNWLEVLYFGAKKEFGEENGPFIKIY